tara:strand:+ start:849 stop:1304 length:456 start_codon:yes stop_codon:yes gene_type:complete
MSLYDSDEKVNQVIEAFTELHQCTHCNAYFTELANVGTWGCRYHPGKYNYEKDEYECCGEKPMNHSNYNNFAAFATWKHKYTPRLFSLGCKRCDHRSPASKVPYKDIKCEKIAQLIPFMKPPLEKRNISKRDTSLVRKEYGGCPTRENTLA